jgi:hypothetical protein
VQARGRAQQVNLFPNLLIYKEMFVDDPELAASPCLPRPAGVSAKTGSALANCGPLRLDLVKEKTVSETS